MIQSLLLTAILTYDGNTVTALGASARQITRVAHVRAHVGSYCVYNNGQLVVYKKSGPCPQVIHVRKGGAK